MSIFSISFKNALTYRSSVLFNVIGSIFNVLVSIALWKYVYSYDTYMMNYMIVYVIAAKIIGMFYSSNLCGEIGSKVSDGSMALELIRPINFLYLGYMKMLGQICANLLMKALPVFLVFLPLIIQNIGMINLNNLMIVMVVVLLGHFLFTILFALIGFIAFVCFEIWPFQRMMNDTIRFLSGSFLPLALFPDWLKTLSAFFPFRFLYSLPIEILLGSIESTQIVSNILLMCIWIAGLGGLLAILYNKAVNKFVVQGG